MSAPDSTVSMSVWREFWENLDALVIEHKSRISRMESQPPRTETDDHSDDENTRSGLSSHSCNQCPTWIGGDLSLFDRLPTELKLKVISEAIIPPPPCMEHLFSECIDPWSCRKGMHPWIREGIGFSRPSFTPCPLLTCLDPLFQSESHKMFFENNVFLFNFSTGYYNRFEEWFSVRQLQDKKLLRDPVATRLLDFTDQPKWRGVGSEEYQRLLHDEALFFSPSLLPGVEVDLYRYNIQHLVLKNIVLGNPSQSSDWDGMLKVDWKTLTNLKTLVLDLRPYTWILKWEYLTTLFNPPNVVSEMVRLDRRLRRRAKRMECLNLESLIIYGIRAGPSAKDSARKQRIHEAFRKAVAPDGVLEFRDETLIEW